MMTPYSNSLFSISYEGCLVFKKTLTENCQSRKFIAQSPMFGMAAIPGFQLAPPHRNC